MSLIGALNTGKTALAVQQAAIQVTGNNIANAGNANYSRETVTTTQSLDVSLQPGVSVGTGVDLTGISRQVDQALNSRLQSATSDSSAATTTQNWLGQVQSVFNALSGSDLSSQLSKFSNDWSTLAGDPTNTGQRQVVLQDGQSLASYTQGLQSQLTGVTGSIDQEISGQAKAADGLAQQVASLNQQIVVSQSGSTSNANSLLDQRDAALSQLSQLVNIKTVQQPNGSVNVYVGSDELVDGNTNNGIVVKQTTDSAGNSVPSLVYKTTGGTVSATSGELGSLLSARGQVTGAQNSLNTLAGGLIFNLNKLHSSGQGLEGYSSTTSTNAVTDPTAALNSPAGLAFTPTNGSFVVHVTNTTTGLTTSTLVKVNLNGASGTDTTLNSLSTDLGSISGVKATITNGKLTLATTSSDSQISFSQDSSGTLAALGINTFFTGTNANTIGVNQQLVNNPNLVAAAQNGSSGDNQTALAISKVADTSVTSLGGVSINDYYTNMVDGIGNSVAAAKTNATAAQNVHDTLTAQQSSLSGVSLDEEMVNLLQQQQAFQAASRVVVAVNTMMQTLVQMV